MRVQFIGDVKRTNSFGAFEPGKQYDVSQKVGEQLLTAPNLFVDVNAPKKRAKVAEDEVIEVADVTTHKGAAKSKYTKQTARQLQSAAKKRGITTRRGARKVELIALLEEQDRQDDSS